jgi:tetratricopeptide (TPR) repeat protein
LKRELKKQIKQDDFRTGLETAASWITQHQRDVKILGSVLVVVVLAAVAGSSWQADRVAKSERAFAEALALYHAPVQGESASPGGAAVVYATPEQKYTAAAAAFDGIERQHGSLPAARRARYYAALCRIELGQLDEAEKGLSGLTEGADRQSLEPEMARLALAALEERRGRVDEAVAAYQRLVDDEGGVVPRDHALLRLSETLERADRSDEAIRSYRRLYEQFPTSVYAAEAQRRVEYLSGEAS